MARHLWANQYTPRGACTPARSRCPVAQGYRLARRTIRSWWVRRVGRPVNRLQDSAPTQPKSARAIACITLTEKIYQHHHNFCVQMSLPLYFNLNAPLFNSLPASFLVFPINFCSSRCGACHVVAIDDSSRVWSWGYGMMRYLYQ